MACSVVAIDVGGTKIAGALVVYESLELPPTVECARQIHTIACEGGEAVLARVVRMAEELVNLGSKQPLEPVAGVGVGAAGVVDPTSGSIRYANDIMPGWSGQPVKSRLEEATHLPVAVLGDVHAHALGEARWGAARGAESCLCVGAGTGLGGAYVLDGNVVRGFRGAAGHVGHSLHPAADDELCACGARSHVETVASGTAIAAQYQGKRWDEQLDPSFMGAQVAALANAGDLEALAVIERAGRVLGEAIGSWCNLFDPELVVLSGSVCAAGPLWRSALDAGFKSQVMKPLAETPIVNAGLGGDAPLVGAAEHLIDEAGLRRGTKAQA